MVYGGHAMMFGMAGTADNELAESPVRGDVIRRLREEAGTGQQVFATNAGIGMSTLRRAEGSDPGVTYRNIVKIARALEVDPSVIYADVDPSGTIAPQPAPPWAVHQHEQLSAQIRDLQRTVEMLANELRGRR